MVRTKRAGPGERVPFVVGAHCILEDDDRQVGERLARFALQNWLLSAVNRSGAVSPAMRASPSSTPVTMPLSAAL